MNSAIKAIHHRGPVDNGIFHYKEGAAHLGQVGLPIIDLCAAGHQSKNFSYGSFVITYNVEFYNFLELKDYLESTFGFIVWKSSSDTEVILEGFVWQGYSFLARLNGIFNLVIFYQK